jgi:23S rRNA (adenine2503-C2)-methyltransferase
VLSASHGFAFDPSRLLVSSVGIAPGMLRLARSHPHVRQALSLHSARQEVRTRLIPLASRHPLPELRSVIEKITDLQSKPLMIEYLLLRGLNDQPEDLEALSRYLAGLDVHINLIPYNQLSGEDSLAPTPPPERRAFASALKAHGFKVTMRYSLGADIFAACGQLASVSAE